jgi:hypothetical protein
VNAAAAGHVFGMEQVRGVGRVGRDGPQGMKTKAEVYAFRPGTPRLVSAPDRQGD